MAKTQLTSVVTWGDKREANSPSHKFTLNAVDYGFELNFEKGGNTAESRNNFTPAYSVPMTKDILRNFGRGLLAGFLVKLRGNQFRKSTDELKPEVFFDGRQVISLKGGKIAVIRLTGGYKIEDNSRRRFTIIKVYELNGWDEVSAIRSTKKYDESKCIVSMYLNPNSAVEDCFSPEDRMNIEIIEEMIGSIVIGTNATYSNHLTAVRNETTSKEDEYSKKNKTSEAAAGGTVTETTEDSAGDDFPF